MNTEKTITCHECGSEITEADQFCPYCGISLSTVAVPDEPDDSMESTIAISRDEINAFVESNLAPAADNVAVISEPAEPEAAPEPVVETAAPEAENIEDLPLPDDIPPPAILSDITQTSGNLRPSSTTEFSIPEEAAAVEEIAEIPASAPPSEDAGIVIDEFVIPPMMDKVEAGPVVEEAVEEAVEPPAAEEETADEPVSIDEPEPAEVFAEAEPALVTEQPEEILSDTIQTTEDQIEEKAETEEVPAASVVEETPVPESAEAAVETETESAVETETPVEAESPVEEIPFTAEENEAILSEDADVELEEIIKPSEDISQYDSMSSNSMFDSVQIIEPTPSSGFDDLETPGADTDSSVDDASPIAATGHSIGKVDTDGKQSAKLKPLSEGTILNGRYEIVRKIGGGGMGAVYLASDNNLGGVLRAVKEMIQSHIEEEQQEKAINDFKRESMILSSLDHISIPTIYDYFYDEDESRFYLVMKYIAGGDLSTRLRSTPGGRIEEKQVCEWAIQITDVLDYLHNQPSTIVYRDLKPSNVMVDGNTGRAMLIDFGIARSINQKEEKGVTAVGTMGYAPPELFSGNVEPRSDIYSLGSTMFHLLCGADPQSNPLLIFDFQKNPRPRQINPQISDQIERIIMRAVQYTAEERYGSAAEMRDVLEDHLVKLKAGMVTYGVSEVPVSISLENQSVFCGFCGQRIVATDMFCAFCGAKQPMAQQGVHSEIYSQTAWSARLIIEGTSELTAPVYALQKEENLLGRRDPMSNIFPEVDLSKYDPQTKISRRHARIWQESGNFLVEDLGSSNGTIILRSNNDTFRLLPRQSHILSTGDRIKVGDATLHFVVG